jgi:hypothetical protein
MNGSIAEFHYLIRDGNDVDLTDINDSISRLESQIDNMNSPKLITTRVSPFEPIIAI